MTLNATQLELPYFILTAENVQQSLSALGTAKATPTAIQDEDFHLFRQRHRRQPWRWEGAGTTSERNFATEASAIADAQAKLT